MVLISTENLERMRQMQQHQIQPEMTESLLNNLSTKKNTTITNEENDNNNNFSVRTPGTPLSRLDAEMWRILNLPTPRDEGERWKLYKEVLQRYLHFVREAKKRLRDDTRNNSDDVTNVDDDDQDKDIESRTDDDFMEIQTHDNTSISSSGAVSESSFGKKRAQSAEKIKEILNSVPQTYRSKANALLKYLLKIPPSKISWDKRGLVTIDGVVVAGSKIDDLINDAIRERKTMKAVGRIQFAQLLYDIGAPSGLIGNRDLMTMHSRRSLRIKKSLLRGSSTPKTPLAHSRSFRRKLDETEGDSQSVYLSVTDDSDNNKTLSDGNSSPEKKKGLFHWRKL